MPMEISRLLWYFLDCRISHISCTCKTTEKKKESTPRKALKYCVSTCSPESHLMFKTITIVSEKLVVLYCLIYIQISMMNLARCWFWGVGIFSGDYNPIHHTRKEYQEMTVCYYFSWQKFFVTNWILLCLVRLHWFRGLHLLMRRG